MNKEIKITDRANSFSARWGGTGTDFKVYFDNVEQLKQGIRDVYEGIKEMKKQQKELEGEEHG